MPLVQGLVAEAVGRGHEVGEARSSYSWREGGVDVVVDGFAYAVTVRQEFPQSTNPERSARPVVEHAHGLTSRPVAGGIGRAGRLSRPWA
jgi:hypothetical protein